MSKSRSGKTPSNNQSAPSGPAQNAIIPGKFMESDWYELLEIEEDENFIADIIDEITDGALEEITKNIIKSRVLPHTVLSVRDLLLDVIEWEFLQSDPGEKATNETLSWIEDDEPSTSVIDNWAQGAVPVEKLCVSAPLTPSPSTPLPSVEEDVMMTSLSFDHSTGGEEMPVDISELRIHDDDEGCVDESPEMKMDEDSMMSISVQMRQSLNLGGELSDTTSYDNNNNDSPAGSQQGSHEKMKSKKYRPHVGQLPTFEKISLQSVTDLRPKPGTSALDIDQGSDTMLPQSEQRLVRNQYGRASGPKEVVYDENGKVVKVEKLDVSHFPNHRVPVKYSIVDSEDQESTTKSITQLRRGSQQQRGYKKNNNNTRKQLHDLKRDNEDKMKHSVGIDASMLLQRIHPTLSNTRTPVSPSDCNFANSMSNGFNSLQPRSPLPPLMVDSMTVTDGVTIREGGLSKQVIKKSGLESITRTNMKKSGTMMPISDQSTRVLNVKDIVADSSPRRFVTNTA